MKYYSEITQAVVGRQEDIRKASSNFNKNDWPIGAIKTESCSIELYSID